MELDFRFGPGGKAAKKPPASTLDVLVVAPLSGQSGDGLAGKSVVPVRIEDIEAAFAAIAPALSLPGEGESMQSLSLRSLDDFHPDELYGRAALFAPAREGRLVAPAPAAAAAPSAGLSDLDRLLGRSTPAAPAQPAATPTRLDALIANIVAPHLAAAPDARATANKAANDAAAGFLMRAVLRDPGVQRLERAWRSVHFLLSRADSDDVRVFLLDANKDELSADVARGESSTLHDVLAKRGVPRSGGRYALVVIDVAFSIADIAAVSALADLAASAAVPVLAGVDSTWLGCPAWPAHPDPRDFPGAGPHAPAVAALRGKPAAAFLGLAAPGFLLRAPYGAKTSRIDAFPFEELADGHARERLLWASGAFACALPALAQLRAERDGEDVDDDGLVVDDLPQVTYDDHGERALQPCAESLLSDRAADVLLSGGLMPLLAARDRTAVKVARVQSCAEPPRALGG